MKNLALIVASIAIIKGAGMVVFGYVFCIGGMVGFVIAWLRMRRNFWMEYGARFENLYLVDDRAKPFIEYLAPGLLPLIRFVEHGAFNQVKNKEVALFEKAKNRFYLRSDELRLQVLIIFPAHGEHVNENMTEYAERAITAIKADRATRHENLKNIDPAWYEKHYHEE